jgi:hypothetical protein
MYVDAVFTVAGPLYYSGRSGRSECRSGVGGQILCRSGVGGQIGGIR